MYSDAQHIVLFSVFNDYLFRILNKGNFKFYVKCAQVRNNRIRGKYVLLKEYYHPNAPIFTAARIAATDRDTSFSERNSPFHVES